MMAAAPSPTPKAILAWKDKLKMRFAIAISLCGTAEKGKVLSEVKRIEREAPTRKTAPR